MKNSFKKSLALLISAVMLFGASPIIGIGSSLIASAASESDLTFALINNDTEYEVSGYLPSASGDITIPSTHDGKPVTSIGDSAFRFCAGLTNVTIPDSVTSIGKNAFYSCGLLTSVTIPDSVTNIGASAFQNCSRVESVEIPASVTSIGSNAFSWCGSLESVTFAEGIRLECIDDDTFGFCRSLVNIAIPDSVTSIGSYAFYSCDNLESVTIKEGVTSIGYSVFSACYDLKEIIVAESNPNYSSENGVLFNKAKTKLLQYPIGKAGITYTIPDGAVEIGGLAFKCSNLETFVIPASVERFGEYALNDCRKLKTITVDEGNAVFSSQDGVLFNKAKTVLYKYPAANDRNSYTVPESVIGIVDYAFDDVGNLTTVILPNGLKSIGEGAFEGCSRLYSSSIPDSVESIGQFAFYYTGFYQNDANWEDGLLYLDDWLIYVNQANTQIIIKSGTRGVSDGVGRWCNSVESVVIPSSVETIGEAAFTDLSNLAEITVDSNNPNYCAENNVLFNKDKTELIVIAAKTASTAYTIPDGVTSIAVNAFFNIINLADITIPDSVERIGSCAFEKTAFYNNEDNWSDGGLYLNNWLLAVKDDVENIVIRPDTRMIADDAFDWCEDLKEVLIPNSVEHIGKWAFENCNNMTSITIPNPATTIGELAFNGVADDFVIKGISGSFAETYAYENDIAFESISVSVTGVSLDITSKTLAVGGTQQLTATVAPEDATNQNVTWESSNPDVATVDENGLVTANSVGIAIIAVITADGSKLDFCTIRVTVPVTGVSLDITSKTLAVGVEQQLTATVTPDNATNKAVTWASSDTAIATVDENGLVTAIAAGTATITVTTADGSKTATCEITVVVPVTGVALDITSNTLIVEGKLQLTATAAPDNATNKNVTWASSDTAIATVDENGLVTAIAAGTATITVTTADGNKTATCEITVVVPVTGVALDITSKTLAVGVEQQLTATVTPDNATNKDVTWTSSDTAIATVDENGLVTAIAAGTATITVTTADGGKTATCEITVVVPVTGVSLDITSKALVVGGAQQLTATAAPDNATNKDVTWASSDTAIATVDENGLVTAIAAGTATITVTTADGSKTATCEITVVVPVTGVALDITSKTLAVGVEQQLTATAAPDNATNKDVTWASSDTAIATVDENGLVTAIAAGTATITVTTVDGNKTATCEITVVVPVTGVTLDITSNTLIVEGKLQLTATAAPDNATNKNVTWASSDTAIATVDENGLVTAIAAGTATITVTTADGNKTATCEITVVVPVTGVTLDITSNTLIVEGKLQLTATAAPDNATNKDVTWASSDTAIATVDENGLVTAIAAGTATITVTTADGSQTATCSVTVLENRVVKIDILTPMNTVRYTYKNSSLDKAGLSIKVTYLNDDTETIDDTSKIDVSGFNVNKKGEQKLTVEYGGVPAEEKITVTVKYSFVQWLIIIFLFGWLWY